MGDPTDVYVNPDTGVDTTGNGSSGSPYASLQFAYDDTTLGTDGTRFLMASGTTDSTSNTSLTMANGSSHAPIYIQGDGGLAEIDTGTAITFAIAYQYFHIHDMEITTTSPLAGVELGQYSTFLKCLINGTLTLSGSWIKAFANTVVGRVNITGTYSRFAGGKITCDDDYAIRLNANTAVCEDSIIICSTGADGAILLTNHNTQCSGNSLYVSSGTVATGIYCDDSSFAVAGHSNLLDGFTTALKTATNANKASLWANSSDGETTLEDFSAEPLYQPFDADHENESLAASPFTNAASGDFTPVSAGNIADGFYATGRSRGAVGAPGGGTAGMFRRSNQRGGF